MVRKLESSDDSWLTLHVDDCIVGLRGKKIPKPPPPAPAPAEDEQAEEDGDSEVKDDSEAKGKVMV